MQPCKTLTSNIPDLTQLMSVNTLFWDLSNAMAVDLKRNLAFRFGEVARQPVFKTGPQRHSCFSFGHEHRSATTRFQEWKQGGYLRVGHGPCSHKSQPHGCLSCTPDLLLSRHTACCRRGSGNTFQLGSLVSAQMPTVLTLFPQTNTDSDSS